MAVYIWWVLFSKKYAIYKITKEECVGVGEFICRDNIHFDLLPNKTTKEEGIQAKNHGESLINAYLPKTVLKFVMINIKNNTEWSADSSQDDESQGVLSITASMDVESQPNVYVYKKHVNKTGEVRIKMLGLGPVQSIISDSGYQAVYRGTHSHVLLQ